MSLFQAREWWSVPSDADDTYDAGGLVVASIGGEDKIITGSFSGLLRIWQPSGPSVPGASLTANDLLLEERLNAPILQMAAGRFSSIVGGTTLAVLHPHKITIYSFSRGDSPPPAAGGRRVSGSAASGPALFHRLNKLFDHLFANTGPHFTAANMCFGPFGRPSAAGSSGMFGLTQAGVKDLIAVQSMDGQVIVYEQEKMCFRRNLNLATRGAGAGEDASKASSGAPALSANVGSSGSAQPLTYLIPGPISYCPRTDSIVTVNSEMKVESFRYDDLAGATGSDSASAAVEPGASQSATPGSGAAVGSHRSSLPGSGRRLRVDWQVNIGEHAGSMALGRVLPAAVATSALVGSGSFASSAFGRPPLAAPAPSSAGASGGGGGTSYPCDLVIAAERSLFVVRDSGPTAPGAVSALRPTASFATLLPLSSSSRTALGDASPVAAGGEDEPGQQLQQQAAAAQGASISSSHPLLDAITHASVSAHAGGGIVRAAAGVNGIRSHRKLDFTPAAMAVYSRGGGLAASSLQALLPEHYSGGTDGSDGGDGSAGMAASPPGPRGAWPHGLILVSHTGVMHVYREDTLVWAARLPPAFTATVAAAPDTPSADGGRSGSGGPVVVPVAVAVGRFGGTAGLVAVLSSRGDLSLCYCGTDPPTGALTGGESVRDLDYAAMDREQRALVAKIRELQAVAAAAERGGGSAAAAAHASPLAVSVEVPSQLLPSPSGGGASGGAGADGRVASRGGVGIASGLGAFGHPVAAISAPAATDDEHERATQLQRRELEDLRYAQWESDDHASAGGGGGGESHAAAASDGKTEAEAAAAASQLPICLVTVRLSLNPSFFLAAKPAAAVGIEGPGSPTSPLRAGVLSPRDKGAGAAGGLGVRDVSVTVASPPWALLPRGKRHQRLAFIGIGGGDAAPGGEDDAFASSEAVLLLPFRASTRGMPGEDLAVSVCCCYTLDGSGETRTVTQSFDLPLPLVAPVVPPLKTAAFKLTLEANRSTPPSLLDLFSDCLTQPPAVLPPESLARIASTGAFVLSFGYRNGADATILVSKSGGKYRVQAGSLEALTLVTAQLSSRLHAYFGGVPAGPGEPPAFALRYTEPLPLSDYMGLVTVHLGCRRRLHAFYSELNDRCHEYRLVAKRLLVRWKDTSPLPLNGLDRLMEMAQENVVAAGRRVEETTHLLAAASNRLGCGSALVALLVRLRFGLDGRSYEALRRALPSAVVDTLESGWEETADAGLVYCLRAIAIAASTTPGSAAAAASTAAGGAASAGGGGAASSLSMPPDTERLKGHLAQLLEVLSRAQADGGGKQGGKGSATVLGDAIGAPSVGRPGGR